MTEKLYTLDQAQRELARWYCAGEMPFHSYVVDTDALNSHDGGNPTALRCRHCEQVWPITEAGSIDLRRINDALVAFGISYPLGANAVDGLIGMVERALEVVARITEIELNYRRLADPEAAANSIRLIGDVLDE